MAPKSKTSRPLTLRLHLWFEREGRMWLGMGRAMLLRRIEEHGSLRQAALELSMSYRAAWGKIKAAEAEIGAPLLSQTRGRRSELTPLARDLVARFERYFREVETFALTRAEQEFGIPVLSYDILPGLEPGATE
jgi:molybdate transport system regulatory protein